MAVSVRDVAAAASVSVGTVSNVLNNPDKVAPATVERVHEAIRRLGFVRNDAARQLRAGRSRCIGLAVLDVGNPFFTDIARAAEARAAESGLTVLLGTTDENPERERLYLDTFDELRVYGMLVSPVGDDLSRLERMRSRGTPVVLVDRDGAGTPFSSVAVDDVAGGEMAVGHLVETGRRRIVFVGGPSTLRQVRDRLDGARRAAAAHSGVTVDVIETPDTDVASGRIAAERIAALPGGRRPDAVFCVNDLLALGVVQELLLRSVAAVPQDIAVVGYDDIGFAASAIVPLTSVRQPRALLGSAAVDLLTVAVDDPRREPEHVCFQPVLVPRASTRY
ncbi:LacI family DNA-binding transcriptional regulator (plasmid) [Prescottella equi]|uniref:LacI family DNA-binding transcriptional regulator n=1 Tax=Rhodococcus hoagii TaxID=43767 RepID=UPI002577774E|nr:LacI family DNA-binding transcriptional regulator [Prescottella equi]WJJ14339.1 LacI family DNA-binding transcriptional regulator [Prescottella equi]